MKIAFVNNTSESLGVEYLSAYLKKHGYEVRVFVEPQLFNDEYMNIPSLNKLFSFHNRLVNNVVNFSPDLIGFSVVTDFYDWACFLASELKKRCDKPIIFGGIHPTLLPEEVLKNEFVDMVCIGEGELALLEVVERLQRGSWPDDVLNIWSKNKNKLIKNRIRPLVDNLDILPYPDKTAFYEESPHYKIGYFTMASRGCMYACSYCCHSYLKKIYSEKHYYRYRSVENVVGELQNNFIKNKFRVIRFSDDIFPFDKNWLDEFSRVYPRDVGIPFICYIHPNTTDEETIYLLKKSGCCEVQIGIQTLSENTQKQILNRHIKVERWEKVISCLKKYKIAITAENIIGIPGQTATEIKELIKFYCKNKVNRIHVFWLRYYPKTEITERFKLEQNPIEKERMRPFTLGGDVFAKELNKMRALFVLLNFLPKKLIYFILSKNLYKYIPSFPLVPLNILSNLTSGSASDMITRRREFKKYIIYIKRKIWNN